MTLTASTAPLGLLAASAEALGTLTAFTAAGVGTVIIGITDEAGGSLTDEAGGAILSETGIVTVPGLIDETGGRTLLSEAAGVITNEAGG